MRTSLRSSAVRSTTLRARSGAMPGVQPSCRRDGAQAARQAAAGSKLSELRGSQCRCYGVLARSHVSKQIIQSKPRNSSCPLGSVFVAEKKHPKRNSPKEPQQGPPRATHNDQTAQSCPGRSKQHHRADVRSEKHTLTNVLNQFQNREQLHLN